MSAIYVEISIAGQQKRFPTGVKINRKYYPTKKYIKASNLRNILKEPEFQNVSEVERRIDEIIGQWRIKHSNMPISIIGVEREYMGETSAEKNVFDYYKEFLAIKKNGNHNTYLTHSRTHDLLLEFSSKHKIFTFDDLNNVCFDKFRNYLEKKTGDKNPEGMAQSSVASRFEKLREFIGYYFAAKKHSNTIFQTYKFKKKSASQNKFIVTITLDELKVIRAYKFKSKRLERIRDYFVLQTMIGQRYIDFIRLNSSMYYVMNNKYHLDFLQHKTERQVAFGLHLDAYTYFEKWVVNTPECKIRPICNSKYNNYLKEALSLIAKDDCPSLLQHITKTNIIGSRKIEDTRFKYQWITTHSARRTYINIALEAGVPVKTILGTTGHTKSEILDVYINQMQNQEEFLDRIKY